MPNEEETFNGCYRGRLWLDLTVSLSAELACGGGVEMRRTVVKQFYRKGGDGIKSRSFIGGGPRQPYVSARHCGM